MYDEGFLHSFHGYKSQDDVPQCSVKEKYRVVLTESSVADWSDINDLFLQGYLHAILLIYAPTHLRHENETF